MLIPRTTTTHDEHGDYTALGVVIESQRVPWPVTLARFQLVFGSAVLGHRWLEAGPILAMVFATSPESAARLWIDMIIYFQPRARARGLLLRHCREDELHMPLHRLRLQRTTMTMLTPQRLDPPENTHCPQNPRHKVSSSSSEPRKIERTNKMRPRSSSMRLQNYAIATAYHKLLCSNRLLVKRRLIVQLSCSLCKLLNSTLRNNDTLQSDHKATRGLHT